MSNGAVADVNRRPNDPGTGIATSESAPFTLSSLRNQLKGSTLLPLMIAGAAAIALIAALLLWASSPVYRVLFSNLGEADGGRIINELDARAIPYQFSDSGQAILVPGELVHTLRLQLAEQGLPQGGNVGFELLDNQAFGISQFTEQVNYQRGLEGELARSIESLSPVTKARVHLSLAKASVFIREREPAKASVVLTLQGGRALGTDQVTAIMHLVSSSVPDLAVEQVTVVDHAGNLLSRTDNKDEVSTTHLAYIEEVERRYQERIETMLVPMFGSQNIQVQVAADIDFSVREETSERYAPNQSPETAAIRSTQLNSSYNGGDQLTAGIPGALSNTPPGWAPSFITPPVVDPDADPNAQPAAAIAPGALNTLDYDNIVNYEVDRNITHIQHQRGQIQRLSVATLVNYRDGVDEEGNRVQQPLEPAEMEQVERLVRQAMGFSAARGDEVEVVNSAFSAGFRALPAEDTLEWWEERGAQELMLTGLRYLLISLFALALYLLLLRPLLRRHLVELKPVEALASPAPIVGRALPGIDEDAAMDELDAGVDAVLQNGLKRRRKASSYEQYMKDVREMAQEDPRMVAMVVRSWMIKNG